ncbi:acyltransferase family protein [Sphingomonas qomolangmaensis]|uniref:Acyltransferase n=1 Tax=Sphingomonas qomolangmaensis TaxID=2918765 RepID=A0ABY5L7F2_9SPHN|nr:acyltransferase family protein [Sphingomonas qomolangmaensis]UUL82372.1 acyltransferase [Sphingomonas qomolangmaensis]
MLAQTTGADTRPEYLGEIQGLRTVAALLVAFYHVWLGRVSGGVDVFFVVAAFFMTRSFVKWSALRVTAVRDYWLLTARRVLPGTALVVLTTVLAVLAIAPESSWRSEFGHALASILFLENWNLANEGTDYLSRDLSSSAFQQMWALSLQVQFYFIFPLLIWAVMHLARRTGVQPRTALLFAFAVLLVASLLWSIFETARFQPRAYFDTFARAWEFAAGALLALTIHRIRLSPGAARVLGLAALVVLLGFAAVIDVSSQFPGVLAAVPVLAAVSVIVAAQNGGRVPVLTWTPLVRAGDYSFSFYLWHWPLLVCARLLLDRQDVGLAAGVAILLFAALLAYASTRFAETPFRRHAHLTGRPALTLVACGLVMLPAAGAIAGAKLLNRTKERQAWARVLAHREGKLFPASDQMFPDAIVARRDISPVYADGCHQDERSAVLIECMYGVKHGRATVVVLVGGSHSAQWLPVLQALAPSRALKVVNLTKSACYFGLGRPIGANRDASCEKWNEAAVRRITELKPHLVFTIATRPVDGRETVPSSYRAAWRALDQHNIPVLALRDNPWMQRDAVQCAELHPNDAGECGLPRRFVYADDRLELGPDADNVTLLDFSEAYCPGEMCPVVHDGILRYRDRHHLTTTYTLTFHKALGKALDRLLPASRSVQVLPYSKPLTQVSNAQQSSGT